MKFIRMGCRLGRGKTGAIRLGVVLGLLGAASAWADEPIQARVLLVAKRHTILSSRLAGPIERMTVNDGDRFDKGGELVTMNCVIQQAELEKVQAEHDAARHTLEARKGLQNLASGSALETRLAAAEVARTGAEVRRNQATVGMCRLSAPFSGRVVMRHAQPFQSVTPGQPLLEILDDSDLSATLIVPSRWLRWLRMQTPFTMNLDETGKTYQGHVVSIGSRIDPASQSVAVTGEIHGDHPELLAGMSGAARFDPPADLKP
ncbi:MAG: efflux RND transporter periplasmic adaptor subunit [Magnetococcales bacterium]|nr:efflux RND transporter periplasmic adaptor subunit [Magnetococcales bacterium]